MAGRIELLVAALATVPVALERAFVVAAGTPRSPSAVDAALDSPLLLVELLLSEGNMFCSAVAKLVPVVLAEFAVD
jgi:hypothetical protein